MKSYSKTMLVSACLVALSLVTLNSVHAQCNTCAAPATPVVAYSPVVQSTVTYEPYKGWYLGKWLDNMRMRRWGYAKPTTVTATTVGYAPTTAGYAPYTAGYTPYTTNYASTAYTTNYAPASYSTPYVTAYAPLGQRQVLMRPVVVGSPVVTSGCSSCSAPAPCSACSSCEPCSSCAGSVQGATYSAPVASSAPACSSCAGGSSITYATPSGSSGSSQMSAPSLTPQEAAPLQSDYPPESDDVTPQKDPGPEESSTYLEAPKLFNPQDRTAQKNPDHQKPINRSPSVDVWTAVYSKPVASDNISTTTQRSQAEIDAAGWHSVPAK